LLDSALRLNAFLRPPGPLLVERWVADNPAKLLGKPKRTKLWRIH
jgi:hypothetical protein